MPPSINGAEHAAPVLVVPGWRDSGAEHWQSVWLGGDPGFRKLVQDDWENRASTSGAELSRVRSPASVSNLPCSWLTAWAAHWWPTGHG